MFKKSQWAALAVVAFCAGPASALCGPPAQQGWYAGVDLLFLSPKLNAVAFNNIFYSFSPTQPQAVNGVTSDNLEFSQRVYLGYEGEDLGGVQVRWFSFDQMTSYVGTGSDSSGPVPIAGNMGFDVDYIDVELTQRGQFRVWDWQATAGVRYARVELREDGSDEFEWEDFTDALWFGLAGVEFEGAGPTMSVRGSREVIWEGFSIFGSARTSILFGNTDVDTIYQVGGGPVRVHDDFAQVWELQFGVKHVHEFEAVDVVTGIFWEAQRWDTDSNLIGGFALHGFGVQTGIEY